MTALAPRTARYELLPDEVLLLYTGGLSEPESSRPDPSGLTRSLDQCVQVIASAADGGVNSIHRRMAQVVSAQRSMLTASDDIAFLLARLSGKRRYAGTTAPGLTAKPPPLATP
jgi:hypothetical protein